MIAAETISRKCWKAQDKNDNIHEEEIMTIKSRLKTEKAVNNKLKVLLQSKGTRKYFFCYWIYFLFILKTAQQKYTIASTKALFTKKIKRRIYTKPAFSSVV